MSGLMSSSPTPPPSTAPRAKPSTTAHLLVGEQTGAAAAYVGMTRGRHTNTAHLVAESVEDARAQWIAVFSRDRADLGPAHAAKRAADDIDRYGPSAVMQRAAIHAEARRSLPGQHRDRPRPPYQSPTRTGPGIGR